MKGTLLKLGIKLKSLLCSISQFHLGILFAIVSAQGLALIVSQSIFNASYRSYCSVDLESNKDEQSESDLLYEKHPASELIEVRIRLCHCGDHCGFADRFQEYSPNSANFGLQRLIVSKQDGSTIWE